MTGCTYFSSDEWEERLLSDIDRCWNARDLVRISNADPATAESVDEEASVRTALEAVDVSREDLFDAWAAALDVDLRASCPHREVADGRCLFHLPVEHPEKTESALADRVLELVREESDTDRAKYFVGAKFGALELPYGRLEGRDEQPIRLAHVSADRLDLTGATVGADLVAVGARLTEFAAPHAEFEGAVDCTGCLFDTVEWSSATCHDRAAFRRGRFREEAAFRRVRFDRRADFDDAVFEAAVRFDSTTFEGTASFELARFEAAAFGGATFGDAAIFDAADFRGDADFEGGHEFTHGASFVRATFRERADFSDRRFRHDVTFAAATFEGDAIFEGMRVENRATFDEAQFDRSIGFNKARIEGRADFDGVVVEGPADMTDVEFGCDADFRDANFRDETTFAWTRFAETTTFENASFGESAAFTLCEFDRLTDFSAATFDGDATFDSARFEAAAFDGAVFRRSALFDGMTIARVSFDETEAAGRVSLAEADVATGTLVQPPDRDAYYDFAGATVGDVTLEGGPNPLAFVRFRGTTFDGFDFSHHAEELAANNWEVHSVSAPELFETDCAGTGSRRRLAELLPWSRAERSESPSELQDTYLKAKNGADEMGQNTAASKFFLMEMYYKRQTHRKMAFDVDRPLGARLSSALQYAYNLTFSVTAGYGERPSRTATSSILSIGLFAGLFQLVAGPPLRAGLYLRFSLQAFVALILGDVPTTGSFQLLSALEAFIGAFFIALFVFTLTRSIDR